FRWCQHPPWIYREWRFLGNIAWRRFWHGQESCSGHFPVLSDPHNKKFLQEGFREPGLRFCAPVFWECCPWRGRNKTSGEYAWLQAISRCDAQWGRGRENRRRASRRRGRRVSQSALLECRCSLLNSGLLKTSL